MTPSSRSIIFSLVCVCTLLAAPTATALVRQWGGTAGFDDFGITAPSLGTQGSDSLCRTTPVNIGKSDFIAAVNATAPHSRPWGLTLSGINAARQPVTLTFITSVTDTVLPFEDVRSMRTITVIQTTDSETSTTVIPEKDGFLKRLHATRSLVVERHGTVWTITIKADNDTPQPYGVDITCPDFSIETLGITIPPAEPSRKGGFSLKSDKVEIHRATLHYTPIPPMATITSIDILTSHFLRSTDPLEGFYRISERSLDEQYLRPGGDYLLALLRTPDGGYDIIYISGATHLPSLWHTGMVHGHASPTAHPMQYTATWTDARYRPIASEGLLTVDGTDVITLQFPYLFSTVRLQRLNPTSVKP